ncbi:pyridoxal phosphate-dependent aminotransferase [Patescibacteria group bacterium]
MDSSEKVDVLSLDPRIAELIELISEHEQRVLDDPRARGDELREPTAVKALLTIDPEFAKKYARAMFEAFLDTMDCGDLMYTKRYAASYLAEVCNATEIPESDDEKLAFLTKKFGTMGERGTLGSLLNLVIQNHLRKDKEYKATEASRKTVFGVIDPEREAIKEEWCELVGEIIEGFKALDQEEFAHDDLEQLAYVLAETMNRHFAVDSNRLNQRNTESSKDISAFISLFMDRAKDSAINIQEVIEILAEVFKIYPMNIGSVLPHFELPPPAASLKAVQEAVPEFSAYGHPMGEKPLRELFAEVNTLRMKLHGLEDKKIDPNDIVIGDGGSELIQYIMIAMLEGEDNASAISPLYPLFRAQADQQGVEIRTAPLTVTPDNEFELAIDQLEANIDTNTKVIFINTPNNPSGAILSEHQMRKIFGIAKKYGLPVVSDETYQNDHILSVEEPYVSALSFAYESKVPTIIISSYSKPEQGGNCALRLGAAMRIDPNDKIKDIWETGLGNLMRVVGSPNVPSQFFMQPIEEAKRALFEALEGEDLATEKKALLAKILAGEEIEGMTEQDKQILLHFETTHTELEKRRQLAIDVFTDDEQNACKAIPADGALYLMVKVEGIENEAQEDEFLRGLNTRKRVDATKVSGFSYPFNGYIRLTILPILEDIEEAGKRFVEYAREWQTARKEA